MPYSRKAERSDDTLERDDRVTVSIVSHGHKSFIVPLVKQLLQFDEVTRIILTNNNFEDFSDMETKRVLVINNLRHLSFSANHNNAFDFIETKWFCILNPDMILDKNPFTPMLKTAREFGEGIFAPRIMGVDGNPQDTARRYPTPTILLNKIFRVALRLPKEATRLDSLPQFSPTLLNPDWLGGMFLLMRSKTFRRLGGFDEAYRLYYEDIDLCLRAKRNSVQSVVDLNAEATHVGQFDSHRKPKYFYWHARSIFIFFAKHLGRIP